MERSLLGLTSFQVNVGSVSEQGLHHCGLPVLYSDVEGTEAVSSLGVHVLSLLYQSVDHSHVTLLGRSVNTSGSEPIGHQERNLDMRHALHERM